MERSLFHRLQNITDIIVRSSDDSLAKREFEVTLVPNLKKNYQKFSVVTLSTEILSEEGLDLRLVTKVNK